MKRLTSSQKLELVRQYLDKGTSISQICRFSKISRKTFYQWLKEYRKVENLNQPFESKTNKKKKHHWRRINHFIEQKVLRYIRKYPQYSCHKLTQALNDQDIKISHHAIQNLVERKGLSTFSQRQKFAQLPLFNKLSPLKRNELLQRYLAGEKISQLARNYQTSRKNIYKHVNRLKQLGIDRVSEACEDRKPKGESHWRYLDKSRVEAVLDLVLTHPDWSVHKIYAALPRVEGKPIVGHHGVQNILNRHNLNTYKLRLAWAREKAIPEVPAPTPAPPPPRRLLLWLISPFATIPKFIISAPFTWPFVLPPLLLAAYILEVDQAFRPSVIFPITALTFGLIFFGYSMKYYISLVLVLLSGGEKTEPNSAKANQGKNDKINQNGFLSRILKKDTRSPSLGLIEDLSSVTLKSRPFVSIHIPLYNEKRVVERILLACSSLEWYTLAESRRANYELVVVDDSTDETTEIAKKFLQQRGGEIKQTLDNDGNQIFTSVSQNLELPQITLIHRPNRAGYKGGALKVALNQTDSKSKFVLIFDADFVPYSDTIEMFVKYFELAQNAQRQTAEAENQALDVRHSALDNKIAAVQGYQWHVLNKSENWITRGVRTEYAGSYVVERSAIELYGGLKMIAGSVYAIRRDILDKFGWGTSLTEDFELTLKLYSAGYKVLYTPYIQAPSECVSTIKRLVRQRMRWAEGHSFNVRSKLKELIKSKNLTYREKFEFAYLAPYYLQAAFFVTGTFAWFVSEVIFKINLPYWTAALGWSLVFANFLSLPFINLLGLFLEQSEEKDYLGVASFVLLSYIITPFQAYAAVKGFLEKEEGPWFRTPKTGRITDVIGRIRIGHWAFRLPWTSRPRFRPATAGQISGVRYKWLGIRGQVSGSLTPISQRQALPITSDLAPVSAFNPLTGYKIKPRRIAWVSKVAIASLLIIVMFINYLAFFAEPKEVQAVGTPKIEQQINIIDQEYSTVSTSFSPTDNSLGLITWDAAKFSDISAVYFEAVIKNSVSGSTTTAALFTDGGTEITGSGCQLTTTSASYTRVRATTSLPSCTGYSANSEYSVRIKASADSAFIQAARLIVLQVGTLDQSITLTQTQVEIGDAHSITSTSYADIQDPKFYCFDDSDAGSCSDPAGSVWSPDPTIYFEATLQASAGEVGQYTSIYCPSATDCKISYYDVTNGDLMFFDCDDATCSTGTDTTVDSTDDVGQYSSVYCVSATNCKISYYNTTDTDLTFRDCDNATCSSGTTTQITDSQNHGQYSSIYCLADDNCKMSYYDATDGDLMFTDCGNATCSTNTNTAVATSGDVGQYTSIYCISDADCKVSFYDFDSEDLYFRDCSNATCSTGSTNAIDTALKRGQYTSIYCIASDNCKISYYDETGGNLKFRDCSNATCTTGTFTLIDTAGNVGLYTSIYCLSDTDCKISYYDDSKDNLKFADCDNTVCSTNSFNIVDSGSGSSNTVTAGLHTSGNSLVSSSEVSTSSTSYTLVRSSAISLTAGTDYKVRVKVNSGVGNFVNAKIIFEQDYVSGISELETTQHYNTRDFSTQNASTAVLETENINQYDDDNFGGSWTGTAHFESVLKVNSAAADATSHAAVCTDLTDCDDPGANNREGEVTNTTTTATRVRSSDIKSSLPTTATDLDAVLWCTSDANCVDNAKIAFTDASSLLIIQISSIPVPELVIFTLPGILFLPRIVKWVRQKRKDREKKVAGGRGDDE